METSKKLTSEGIYERGHGSYEENMSYWKRQRELIVNNLRNFGRNTHKLKQAHDILAEAKAKNPKGLIF